jgi:hypothetical protein
MFCCKSDIMATIKILDKIDITINGLRKVLKKEDIFLHQGDMDGACTVYSLMMALIIEDAINFKDTALDAQEDKDQREAKQKLFKAFTSELGLIRGGLNLKEDVQSILKKTFSKYVKSEHCHGKDVDVFVRNSIDKGHPCIGVVSYRGGKTSHAVCVVGYEIGEEEEIVTKIFCLDPGADKPLTSYWNTVIILNADPSASIYTDYYLNSSSIFSQDVSFDEALKVEKKK